MNYELIDQTYSVNLIGKSGHAPNESYKETGMKLMDDMYAQINHIGLTGYGHNHWVYLPQGRMFAGVAWTDESTDTGSLEKMAIIIPRYARYILRGDYSQLPEIWESLMKQIAADGHESQYPSLEHYGDWYEDPTKLETEIIIGLKSA